MKNATDPMDTMNGVEAVDVDALLAGLFLMMLFPIVLLCGFLFRVYMAVEDLLQHDKRKLALDRA